MTGSPTAAEIAGELSERMRSMLRRAHGYQDSHLRCWGNEGTMKALRDRGLCHGDFGYLTPVGLAVRAELERGQ